MKYLLANCISTIAVMGLAHACSIVSGVTMTFYGYPDNSPPGAGTAYNCGGRNYVAGGTGTYSDPLTFASDSSEYSVCEVIYSPYLKKYLRMEDECAQCGRWHRMDLVSKDGLANDSAESDWGSGKEHIDIWTGSSTTNGGQAQINCEDDLTPNTGSQSIIRQPSSSLPVNCK
jgi:hypothetical protein